MASSVNNGKMKLTSSKVSAKLTGGSQSAGGKTSVGKSMKTTSYKPGGTPSYMKG